MKETPIAVSIAQAKNGFVLHFWEPPPPGQTCYIDSKTERDFVAQTIEQATEIVLAEAREHFYPGIPKL